MQVDACRPPSSVFHPPSLPHFEKIDLVHLRLCRVASQSDMFAISQMAFVQFVVLPEVFRFQDALISSLQLIILYLPLSTINHQPSTTLLPPSFPLFPSVEIIRVYSCNSRFKIPSSVLRPLSQFAWLACFAVEKPLSSFPSIITYQLPAFC